LTPPGNMDIMNTKNHPYLMLAPNKTKRFEICDLVRQIP
jgi:hypothetical protein